MAAVRMHGSALNGVAVALVFSLFTYRLSTFRLFTLRLLLTTFPPRCPPVRLFSTSAHSAAPWRAWRARSLNEVGGTEELVLVGIQRRGVELADRLKRHIDASEGSNLPSGKLDITLYRDDLQTIGPRPVVGETRLPDRRREDRRDRG